MGKAMEGFYDKIARTEALIRTRTGRMSIPDWNCPETKKPDETESGRYSSGQFGQNHFCLAITLSLIFA
jgi:hypothetical protein